MGERRADGTGARSTTLVRADEERSVIETALIRHGATEPDAAVQADMLVEADLRGHPSHGIRRLRVLVGRLDAGLAVSGVDPDYRWRTEAALEVDGRRNFGPVVLHGAVDRLLERAATTGIAMASVRNTGHAGMLAPYVERIAAAGSAGIALTVSEALVHPWNGTTAMVGTNPIGVGIPTAAEPFILDMSTAEVSVGRVLDHAARGEPIPPGWALDEHGEPTTDAAAAARGALSPFGGAKGYALGLAVEALVGVLAGSAFGREVFGTLDVEHPPTKGDLLVVFSLDALGARDRLAGLGAYFDELRGSARAGSDVAVPGDRARAARAARLRDGIPLDAELWAEAQGFARPPEAP